MTDVKILEEQFRSRKQQVDSEFLNIKAMLKDTNRVMNSIKDNHLTHIQDDITELKVQVSAHSKDIKWLTKIQWFHVTSGISILIGIAFLIFKNL